VGLSEAAEKILVAANDHYSAGVRRDHGIRRRVRDRAVYLFSLLGLVSMAGAKDKELE
jgi:hypothetical protein